MEICRQDQALEIRELDPFWRVAQAGPGKRAAKRFSSGGRASFQCARGASGKGFVFRVESLRRSGTAASFFNRPRKRCGRICNSCNARVSHSPTVPCGFRWLTQTHG